MHLCLEFLFFFFCFFYFFFFFFFFFFLTILMSILKQWYACMATITITHNHNDEGQGSKCRCVSSSFFFFFFSFIYLFYLQMLYQFTVTATTTSITIALAMPAIPLNRDFFKKEISSPHKLCIWAERAAATATNMVPNHDKSGLRCIASHAQTTRTYVLLGLSFYIVYFLFLKCAL